MKLSPATVLLVFAVLVAVARGDGADSSDSSKKHHQKLRIGKTTKGANVHAMRPTAVHKMHEYETIKEKVLGAEGAEYENIKKRKILGAEGAEYETIKKKKIRGAEGTKKVQGARKIQRGSGEWSDSLSIRSSSSASSSKRRRGDSFTSDDASVDPVVYVVHPGKKGKGKKTGKKSAFEGELRMKLQQEQLERHRLLEEMLREQLELSTKRVNELETRLAEAELHGRNREKMLADLLEEQGRQRELVETIRREREISAQENADLVETVIEKTIKKRSFDDSSEEEKRVRVTSSTVPYYPTQFSVYHDKDGRMQIKRDQDYPHSVPDEHSVRNYPEYASTYPTPLLEGTPYGQTILPGQYPFNPYGTEVVNDYAGYGKFPPYGPNYYGNAHNKNFKTSTQPYGSEALSPQATAYVVDALQHISSTLAGNVGSKHDYDRDAKYKRPANGYKAEQSHQKPFKTPKESSPGVAVNIYVGTPPAFPSAGYPPVPPYPGQQRSSKTPPFLPRSGGYPSSEEMLSTTDRYYETSQRNEPAYSHGNIKHSTDSPGWRHKRPQTPGFGPSTYVEEADSTYAYGPYGRRHPESKLIESRNQYFSDDGRLGQPLNTGIKESTVSRREGGFDERRYPESTLVENRIEYFSDDGLIGQPLNTDMKESTLYRREGSFDERRYPESTLVESQNQYFSDDGRLGQTLNTEKKESTLYRREGSFDDQRYPESTLVESRNQYFSDDGLIGQPLNTEMKESTVYRREGSSDKRRCPESTLVESESQNQYYSDGDHLGQTLTTEIDKSTVYGPEGSADGGTGYERTVALEVDENVEQKPITFGPGPVTFSNTVSHIDRSSEDHTLGHNSDSGSSAVEDFSIRSTTIDVEDNLNEIR